ncbi:MAG: penicillin acylase family protein [Bacteroidetes bacterium]|nr:penicillin acylase family protein [Bacteroidota bacterium]MCH8524971.1 penicillin acylase family protein [Balneolales bacterium]
MIKSFIRVFLLIIIVISGFVAVAIYWTVFKPVLPYETSLTLPELHEEVSIQWDAFGVPSIFALNEHDMYLALGWVHARDRLWQMTVAQLFTEGRFAEFLGEDVIELDTFSRTIGFWKIAGELEQRMDSETLRHLESYSAGVNAFVKQHRNSLPLEFSLAGIHPPEWTPRHTIALSRLLGWELNVSWWTKVMMGYLEAYFDEPILQELFPVWQDDAPRNLSPQETRRLIGAALPILQIDRYSRRLIGNDGTHVGSNAWVSDSSRTGTGYPLLAGDPHLGLDMPGKWYEVHLNLRGRSTSGATIAGAPLIVMGQNEHLAWTFTSLMADDTDFFRERMHPADSTLYLSDSTSAGGTYSAFITRRELIKIKGGEEVLHTIRYTQNGPIINDVYPSQELVEHELLSMRWTGFEITHEIRSLMQMAWAASRDEFTQALEGFGVPALNIMYADKAGNIGMYTAATLPIRAQPSLLLRNGWDSRHRWDRFIPRNHLPKVENPASGFIANANNPVVSENYPYYLTAFWEPDSRIRRIQSVLTEYDQHTPELFKALQNDVYSYHAADITAIILPVLEASNDGRFDHILPYLQNWDFNYTRAATAASLHDMFFLTLVENIFKPYLGEVAYQNFIRIENFPVRVTTQMLKNGSVWLRTDQGETTYRDSLIVASMQHTIDTLSNLLGDDPAAWQWGNLHTLTLSPILFREAAASPEAPAPLRLIVNNLLSRGPFPMNGHAMSVNNTQYSWEEPFDQILGASIRRIIDLQDLNQSWSVLPTGQSANFLAPHFGDQTDLWLSGKYRIFRHYNFTTGDVQRRTTTLKP